MTDEFVVDVCRKAVQVSLMVAGPMLIAGMVVGLIVSIFQATTQVNEQTLTFIPKGQEGTSHFTFRFVDRNTTEYTIIGRDEEGKALIDVYGKWVRQTETESKNNKRTEN